MATQRLSAGVFLGTLIEFIEERTGTPTFDTPENEQSPLYSVQLLRMEPANTKTMFVDRFDVSIHAIAAAVNPHSNAPVLRLIQALEIALDERVRIDEPFHVYDQEYRGIRSLKKDPSGEGHAVTDWSFFICYGFRCK